MTITASEVTALLKIPIPGEDCDPFMDAFREYTRVIEDVAFLTKIMSNLMISGGGTRIWATSTGIFTWTADWTIPIYHWGKKISVKFGTDGVTRAVVIPPGSALVVDIPSVMAINLNRNFRVVSQLNQNLNSEWVVGWNNGGVLQLRDIGEIA